MNNFGLLILSWLTGQEFPQEEFDKDFINYFKTNPNGYDEAMRLIDEQAPTDAKDMIRERMNKIYEQSKKGRNNDSNVHNN